MGKIWESIKITTQDGDEVDARTPLIISASRATDIPAFLSDWFFERLNHGYVIWKNPFNGQNTYVSFQKTRLIVFWTKNPELFINRLQELDKRNLKYYFQFTLNNFDKECLEKKLPTVEHRIAVFKELSSKIGKEKVIWRFDPLVLSSQLSLEVLIEKIAFVADQLYNYTNKLVFSFIDINNYVKVQRNLAFHKIHCREFSQHEKYKFAKELAKLNKKWNLQIASCSQSINLEEYGIAHNKCIDDELIVKLFPNDSELINFLGYDANGIKINTINLKDKGQRKYCGCVYSKDIGQYNTCKHSCVYCYANSYV